MEKNISFGKTTVVILPQRKTDGETKTQKNASWAPKKSASSEDRRQCTKEDYQRRKHHVMSIIALQNEHEEHHIQDATGLKILSRAMSATSLKDAQKRASVDASEAFMFHSESFPKLKKAMSVEQFMKKVGKPPRRTVRMTAKPC